MVAFGSVAGEIIVSDPPDPLLTITVVLCVAGVVRLAPLQVRVKVVVVLSGPVLVLPLIAMLPDQPPEAVQLLALVEDQLSVEAEPLLTVPGLAFRLTVGLIAVAREGACPGAVAVCLLADVPAQPATPAASTEHSMRLMVPRSRRRPLSAKHIELRLQSRAFAGSAYLRHGKRNAATAIL